MKFMAKYYTSIEQLIGNTPLLKLEKFQKAHDLSANIFAKLECLNPAGSVKDRVGAFMIAEAEREGRLGEGSVIIEPTSGNTGIGIAAVAASKGYRVIIVMPDTMSVERRKLIGAYGAEIVLTEGALGMKGAIAKAEELAAEIEGAIVAGQFINPANPLAHYKTTGPEIWEDTEGKVEVFVAGIGTGGTITGVGRYLKEKNPNIKIVGIEPAGSPFLTKGETGTHGLQGIGAGFKPEILDMSVVDEVITISDKEAYLAAKVLAIKEGILVGITSGAAVYAASLLAAKDEYKGKKIVALLPDTGERYLSCEMFK